MEDAQTGETRQEDELDSSAGKVRWSDLDNQSGRTPTELEMPLGHFLFVA